MSLPTPPHTGHREKENRVPLSGPHVIWSPHNDYRTINPIPQVPAATSASKILPTKSILKKRSEVLLPLMNAFERETTPEPSQPKLDPKYLSSPVATIIDPSASLDDLIRAYSVLAARIRANITLTTDSDASLPLIEPLRKNRAALEEAIVRDLSRCLTDPETMKQSPEDMEEEACLKEQPVLLPSPKCSPKKKKKGTTAKKAKYGRDLCTTCHSVIKLLGVVFTLPAVSGVFTVPQLRSILAHVLAIPLSDDLPTPNARKTYALSIWLLQSQRLPSIVLEKAADRIVFALRRGIEGELGKEGKKGSASDGLKAIHDLSVYQPSIFVPKFEILLSSVLDNLLAPTVAIRAQACHALGGFARGLGTLPVSSLHTRISGVITSHLTAVPSPSKKSPTKPACNEAPLVRTLRTTLQAAEAQHVSQGPVWGLSVVANLLVLANSAVYADGATRRVFIALLSLAMNHKKSSIRSLGCAVWRCATWAYFQPLLPPNGEDESEVEEDAGTSKRRMIDQGRELFWNKVVVTVVDMGVGVSTIVALLEEAGTTSEEILARVAQVLKLMSSRGGQNLEAAIDALARMVSFVPPESEWSWNKLLPRGLFSASPGLLTADFSALETSVRSVIAQCPDKFDVRSLSRDEVAQPVIFDKIVEMWKECLGCVGLQDDEPISAGILLVWEHLIQATATVLQDSDTPDEDTVDFANKIADILADILLDNTIDVTLKSGEIRFCTDGPELFNHLSNGALRLKVVRALWAVTRKIISGQQLTSAGEKMMCALVSGKDDFTDSGEVSRKEWAAFSAEVLILCESALLEEFWAYVGGEDVSWEWKDAIATVWRSFAEKWKEESECAFEAIVTLLAVPFTAQKTWELSDSDFGLWDTFFGHAIDKALDYGLDTINVLDHVAASIVKGHNPTTTTTSRAADALLSQLSIEDVRELPETLFEFINDTLQSSYPPEPRNTQQALWTLRSVARAIENCPTAHVGELLRLIEDGLCLWVSDAHQALSDEEYAYDVVNLYEVILMRIRTLPPKIEVLRQFGPILESGFVGREDKPAAIAEAFAGFWGESFAECPVPEEGWPVEILTCLGASGDEVDQLDPADPWDKLLLSPAFRGQVVSRDGKEVPVGSPFKLFNARFRSASPEAADETAEVAPQEAAEPSRPVTPTTPVTVRSRASTPPRPHKLPSAAQSSPTSPDSPLYAPHLPSTPSMPKRTPLRSVGGSRASPNKRRKLDDKENISPGPFITSVMERITAASPRAAVSKKHASPSNGGGERPAKRSKTDATSPGEGKQSFRASASEGEREEEEERLVELSLMEREQSKSSPTGSLAEITPPSKKRKRVLFDAVEVPSVQQVYSTQKGKFPFTYATPSKQDRVQTRSTAKARRVSGESPSVLRKRRRDSDDASEDPFSDDSTLKARASKGPTESSSDDDAYFGQVTPYHVFSPALRRARDDDPPSSDDSNMSASPLKGVVERRLQKTGSSGRLVTLSIQ